MLKFYLDEHMSHALAEGLRRRGLEVVLPAEIGMRGAEDEDHLERARVEGRVMFTADADYIRLHQAGRPHAGIAYRSRPMSIGRQIELLAKLAERYKPGEMLGRLEYL